MRFWGKTKYGDKKTSREKLICGADSMDGDYGDTGPLLGEGASSKSKHIQPSCWVLKYCLLKQSLNAPESSFDKTNLLF